MSAYLDLQFAPALLGLLLIPLAIALRSRFGRLRVGVVPYAAAWQVHDDRGATVRVVAWWYLSLILLVVAAAEPVRVAESTVSRPLGTDVVIAIDVSTSMLAEDLAPISTPKDRLAVLKPALVEFIENESIGRVGLVLFAGRAYTLVPLSADRFWLRQQIDRLEIGDIEDGTAIGDGLGLAISQFNLGEPADRSRMIVLLTDGSNTSGVMTPPQAAAIAKKFSIPIYSVAMGRDGLAPYPIFDSKGRRLGSRQQPSSVDRDTLTKIAGETGGTHQDAADGSQLAVALATVASRLVVTQKQEKILTRTDLARWFLLAAFATLLILAALLYRSSHWRRREGSPQSGTKIIDGMIASGQFRSQRTTGWLRRLPLLLMAATLGVLIALLLSAKNDSLPTVSPRQVLLALDVSRSMDIGDEAGISRLERARRLVSRALDELEAEVAAGVLVFAGSAHLVAPMVAERTLAANALRSFGSTHLSNQGSSYLELIDTAISAFDVSANDKVLVLLSDGEANPEPWVAEISRLKAMGIRVIAVGFGEEKTAPIPDSAGGWLRDPRGMFVYAKPQPENLRRLTAATGGVMLTAHQNPVLLRELLQSLSAPTSLDNQGESGAWAVSETRRVLLGLVLVLLLGAAWREVPATVRLAVFDARSSRAASASSFVGFAVAMITGLLSLRVEAQFPRPLQTIQSAEERDALNEVNAVVREILSRSIVSAEDYRSLARAAANYGAIHRLHAHPISEGVLRDGLAAVQLGRRADPSGPDWDDLERQLQRLLEPPPAVVADDGEIDPANEPLEGKLAMGSSGVTEPQPTESPPGSDTSDADNVQSPGGGAAEEFAASDWSDASVAVPLYLLREVEKGDSYAELFRRMQGRSAGRDIEIPRPAQGW
jgi:Ca-activated chloride channel family protein